MEENLKSIERFFKDNLAVKKLLLECLPPNREATSKSNNKYNVDYVVTNYSDKLLEAIKDIKFYIFRMLNSGLANFRDFEITYVENLFNIYEEKIANCGYNFDSLKKIYKVIFADMREELVKEVGEKCKGYSMEEYIDDFIQDMDNIEEIESLGIISLRKAQSINELLHIIHSKVCNNENLYKKLPNLDKKINNEKYPITLHGDNYDLAKKIFDSYPVEMSCGWTDILGLKKNKKILMMIRDRGHALSIEIDEVDGVCFVNYFIPKICNTDMVNNLKGVMKVTDDSRYTVGSFATNRDSLAMEIVDFISKVPMDDDMIFVFNPTHSFR